MIEAIRATIGVMGGAVDLVTGGAGYIGGHLVRELLARGVGVRVLDIANPLPEWRGAVEFIRGSILDAAALDDALRGVRRLYHLAAIPHLWIRDKREFTCVNLEGTRRVLAAAERARPERIVHCSTESILKGSRRRTDGPEIDETAAPTLDDMPGPYCRSKYLAEQEAWAAERRGLPVIIVNPTLPVGPGDRSLTPPTRMLLLFLNGGGPFYLDCEINMIDVRDVALGHILAAERGRIGERYILGGANLRLRELLTLLREITGRRMPRMPIPHFLALGVAAISEFLADALTGKPPVAPLTGVRLVGSPMRFNASKARRELGLDTRPLPASLKDSVDWLTEQGLVRAR